MSIWLLLTSGIIVIGASRAAVDGCRSVLFEVLVEPVLVVIEHLVVKLDRLHIACLAFEPDLNPGAHQPLEIPAEYLLERLRQACALVLRQE